MNDLVMEVIDKKTAMELADLAENNSAEYFAEKYGVIWPFKFSSFCIAAFVRARIRQMGVWNYGMEEIKKYIDRQYMKEMFDLNDFPPELWPGDSVVDALINTYLLAFLHNGKHVDYDVDECDEDMESIEGYEILSGDYCKFHSKYKGWDIYRAWNIEEDHGKMRYIAVKDDELLEAKNLSGIKYKISG